MPDKARPSALRLAQAFSDLQQAEKAYEAKRLQMRSAYTGQYTVEELMQEEIEAYTKAVNDFEDAVLASVQENPRVPRPKLAGSID